MKKRLSLRKIGKTIFALLWWGSVLGACGSVESGHFGLMVIFLAAAALLSLATRSSLFCDGQ